MQMKRIWAERRENSKNSPFSPPILHLLKSLDSSAMREEGKQTLRSNTEYSIFDFLELFCLWNRISLKNLVYIGAHSIDPYERLIADKFNIHLYGMRVSISLMNYEIMKRFIVRRRFNCSEYREALDAMRTGALQVAEHPNANIV